jgi:hypothetical protein
MPRMTVGGRTVRIDGKPVAYLSYSGDGTIAVRRLNDTVAGRLVRCGDRKQLYDAWTALHEATLTPSDTVLGRDLPLAEGVRVVLHRTSGIKV